MQNLGRRLRAISASAATLDAMPMRDALVYLAAALPLASPYAIGVRCPRAARSLVSMAEPTPDERIAALEKELQAAKLAALEQKLADAKKAMAEGESVKVAGIRLFSSRK